jgi:hypothetical protein
VEITGGWRILRNKELHDICSSLPSGPIKGKHILTKNSSFLKEDSAAYCQLKAKRVV